MPVCTTIPILAKALEDQLSDLTVCQLKMIAVLKEMSAYGNQKRLDLWETAYLDAINENEEDTENFEVIDYIFDLGAHNLYGAFNRSRTETYYREIVNIMKQKGITIPRNLDVSDW